MDPVGLVIPVLLNNMGRSSSSALVTPFVGHRRLAEVVGEGVRAAVDPMNRRLHRIGVMSSVDALGLRLIFDHHPDDVAVDAFDRLIESTVAALAMLGDGPVAARRFDLVDLGDDEIDDLGQLLDALDN